MAIFPEVTKNECINDRHPFVKSDNLINSARYLANGTKITKIQKRNINKKLRYHRDNVRRRSLRRSRSLMLVPIEKPVRDFLLVNNI